MWQNTDNLIPAKWIKNPELLAHLQLCPWIFLPIKFSAQNCMEEAMRQLDRFVSHRVYDQKSVSGGKWKSLALQSSYGNPSHTENFDKYGATDNDYMLTDVAEKCPYVMELLEQITEISQCKRIRFMLLEPGAEIIVHSDAPHKDTSLAVNIAFNMPANCEFWVDLNPDGVFNKFSKKIPIQDESAFIFNTSTYHKVFNHSPIPRMHLIFHGPLRFSADSLLEIARRQNGINNFSELTEILAMKKAYLAKQKSESISLML